MGYGLGGGALVMSVMRVPQVRDRVTLVMGRVLWAMHQVVVALLMSSVRVP